MAQQSAGQIKKYIKQLKQRQEQYLYYLGQLAYQEGDAGKLENPQMLEAYQTLRDIQEQISQWEASLEQVRAAKAEAKQPRCPHCGSAVVKGAVYCPNCGQSVTAPPAAAPPATPPAAAPTAAAPAPAPPAAAAAPVPTGNKCAKCGEPLDGDAVFCGNCGAKVAVEQAPPEPAAAPPPAAASEPAPPAPAPTPEEKAPKAPSPEPEAEGETASPESESPAPAGEAGDEEKNSGGECPGCGADIADESALFCPECGTKVKE